VTAGVADDRSSAPAGREAGFALLPHTADIVIEAWGPSKVACLRAAAEGLVASFADTADAAATRNVPFSLAPAPDPELLLALLEEVIYTVEVFGVVPVAIHLEQTDDGGLAGDMEVIDATRVQLVGAVPKGVSYSGLELRAGAGGWSCRAMVDV